MPDPAPTLPYKIAVLCYLFDEQGRVLMLHRRKAPNQDLYSPIGGKLETAIGESPTTCAVREIQEETGLTVQASDLHLTGIVSEAGHEGEAHWLMYLYELVRPVHVEPGEMDEGLLEWHEVHDLQGLNLPQTDREVIWPLFWRYRGRFFAAHIDCMQEHMKYRLEQPASDAGSWISSDNDGQKNA